MKRKIVQFICLIFLIHPAVRLSAVDGWRQYSAADSSAISEMTAEERQLYQADFFPLSLAEKGRQSAPTWRGMPPGFLDYQCAGISLYNPLWGYWDNQHLPIEIIRQQELNFPLFGYHFYPTNRLFHTKPVTRIAYSQDFQFGLSYLDINLKSFYRPQSFFSLGGNNFLRDGSAGDFSKSQVNTYRTQIFHQLSSKFSVDARYWQIRHKFTLSSYPVIVDPQKIHRIGQLLWINLNYQPDSTRSLVIMPYGFKWGDRYRNSDYSRQRKSESYSLGIKGEYQKVTGTVRWGFLTDAVRHKIKEAMVFRTDDQWNGKLLGNIEYAGNNWSLQVVGGYWFMPQVGNQPELSGRWKMQLPLNVKSNFSIAQVPQFLPLSTLFLEGYDNSSLTDPQMPLRRGISWELGLPAVLGINLVVEPYYYIFKHFWLYDVRDQKFIQQGIENSGIIAKISTGLWLMEVQNEISYNSNYQKSFIPEYKNVLKVNLPFSMFQSALKLENYLIYQFIGKWRKLDYDPLTNQYWKTSDEISNNHLLDVKILAHIKTATIFLVWENLLSEDYAWVDSYSEYYRLFRFGLYWTLFD